jgi:hypothetical protein
MPDNVSLIDPARASGYAEGNGRGRGDAGWLWGCAGGAVWCDEGRDNSR